MEILEFLEKSGKLVIPLIACSIIATTVILERSAYWLGIWWRRDRGVRKRMISGESRVDPRQDRIATILKYYLEHPEDPSRARDEAARLDSESQAFMKVLHWISTLSTSIGLLGTVIGVSMSLKDLGDQEKLVVGLSVALNTTILGLIIYLVSYSFTTLFSAQASHLRREVRDLLEEGRRAARHRDARPAREDSHAPLTQALSQT
jgi:biopolymer transport protein ExbB